MIHALLLIQILAQGLCHARFGHNLRAEFVCIQLGELGGESVYQGGEIAHSGGYSAVEAGVELFWMRHHLPHRHAGLLGGRRHARHRRVPDAAHGEVDDPPQRLLIVVVDDEPEIG